MGTLFGIVGMFFLLFLDGLVHWGLEIPRSSGWKRVVGDLPVMFQGAFLAWLFLERAE